VFGVFRLVAEADPASREVTLPCRVLNRTTLAPLLVRAPPLMPFAFRLDFRVFACQVPGKAIESFQDPLVGFGSPSKATQAPSRRLELLVFQGLRHSASPERLSATPPLRFLTPSALSHSEQRPCRDRVCLTRSPAPSGSLNLLVLSSALSLPALFHAGSALGVALQSLLPSA